MAIAVIRATRPRPAALRAQDLAAGRVSGASLWRSIASRAARHPECPVIFLSDRWPAHTTVGRLLARAEGVAARLAGLGFARGEALAIQLPQSEANTLVLLAAIRLGLVVVPLVSTLGSSELGFILRQTRAKGFVAPACFRGTDHVARFRQAGDLADCAHLLVLDDAPADAVSLNDVLAPADAIAPPHEVDGEDVFAVIYTSGTTASPKGVIHSHSSFEAEMLALGALYRAPWAGGFLNALPAGHIAGMSAALRPFFHGMACVYLDRWDATVALSAIGAHDLVCSTGTGYHLAQLLAAAGDGGLGGFRAMLLGGATIDPALVEEAERRGVQAFRCYGSSEFPSLTCGAPWDRLERRSRTDGLASPGAEMQLIDDEGATVPPGQPGEILCRGPEMFQGFVDPALNGPAFTDDGWYRTGDIGVCDAEGWLTIVDRKKDIIIRGGENLSSREIEEALAAHPGVRAAAVVGYPDALYGERVAAFIEPGEAADISLATVRALFAVCGLARHKTPERLIFIDELPRTASGKVLKAALRRRLAEAGDGPATATALAAPV